MMSEFKSPIDKLYAAMGESFLMKYLPLLEVVEYQARATSFLIAGLKGIAPVVKCGEGWGALSYQCLDGRRVRYIVRHKQVQTGLVGEVEDRWCNRHDQPATCSCTDCAAKICPECYQEAEIESERRVYGR